MTRHRYRPPVRRPRWWPGVAVGLVPHAGLFGAMLDDAPWSRVLPIEIYTVAAVLLLTVVLAVFRGSRPFAGGLLGATAVGLAAVVGLAVAR